MIVKEPSDIVEQHRTSERIKRDLRRQLGRKWRVGDRLPPIKQLAQELNLGQSNTYRAVQDLVNEGLLISAPGRGTFVNGAPIKGAGKWVRLWCLWPKPDQFLRDALDAATAVLEGAGCRVTVERPADKQFDMDQGDAHFYVNPHDDPPVACADHQVMAVVDTGMDLPINMSERYDLVGFNSNHAGVLAGRHLRAVGCKDVCFVGCPQIFDQTSVARFAGLQCGWGRPIAPPNRLAAAYYMSLEGAKVAAEFLKLKPRPDGVCASSDEIAVGFIHGAASHGLEVGRDFQIIGFDGQEFGQAGRHPLTTVKVPMADMGARAAHMLLERLLDPLQPVRRVHLPGTLVQGRTTRPRPGTSA